jgi:S-formylglutathione hydrolase FrmB
MADDSVTVTDVRFPSNAVDDLLWYRAVVPKIQDQERLPVIYFLHGFNGSPAEIMEHSDVVKLASHERLIVVIPNGEDSYYTNARHKRHAQWEDAITRDLPQDVALRFPVLPGREHTGIAGISMGGYGAAKLALKHPEQYGLAGTFGGALDITRRPARVKRWGQTWRIWTIFGVQESSRKDEDVFDLLEAQQGKPRMAWFESCGKQDPLYAVNERFAKRLRESGADLHTTTAQHGHEWASWNAAIPEFFQIAGEQLR